MKKLNKLFAILVAMAMVLSLAAISAFAADPTAVNATLTKRWEMPKGTTNPGGSFSFTFVQDKDASDDEYPIQTGTATLGTNGVYTIPLTSNSTKTTDGDKDVYIGTADLFTTPGSVKTIFPNAGLYKYTVSETAGYTKADDSETVHNSQAAYTVYVTVSNNEAKDDLIVTNITVIKTANDDGTTTGEEINKKPDTQPGEDGLGSKWTFTNTYVKTKATDPDGKDPADENDATTLYVQKILEDDLGVIPTGTTYNFDVTVDLPSLANADVTAEVWNVNGTQEATTYTFEDNKKQEVTLAPDQRLVFTSLPVGTVYTVNEQDLDEKLYTVTNKTNTDTITNDSENAVRVTNSVIETNVSPTGILISNLPYIALALVAIGGLVAYVVVRRRQSDEA